MTETKTVRYKEYPQPVFFNEKYYNSPYDLLDCEELATVQNGTVTGTERVNIDDDALEFLDNALEHHFSDFDFGDRDNTRPVEFLTNDAIGEFKTFYEQWIKKHKPGFWIEDTNTVINFTDDTESSNDECTSTL